MIDEREYLTDLAFGFMQGTLSAAEKSKAHQLIMNSPEFMQILKEEIAMQNLMQALKAPVPPELSQRILSNITAGEDGIIYRKMLQTVLEATLPTMMWPVIKLFQRSVFASE